MWVKDNILHGWVEVILNMDEQDIQDQKRSLSTQMDNLINKTFYFLSYKSRPSMFHFFIYLASMLERDYVLYQDRRR